MKKILLLAIVAMMSVGTVAQIQVSSKTKATETIASARMNTMRLCKSKAFYIVGQTSNQFDDPAIIWLGEEIEATNQALESLLALFDLDNRESAYFTDFLGQKWFVYKFGASGNGTIGLENKDEVQAGNFNIHRAELVKFRKKFLEKFAEELK